MSDPLIVETVEQLFVPVLVRNNVDGAEREVLKRFGEPTWANPSARIVDAKTETTLARIRGDYSAEGVLAASAAGLKKAKQDVPAWLSLHSTTRSRERAAFAMACFWTGEVRLGRLDGVTKTRTGWLNGQEVVEVEFDPTRLDLVKLTQHAETMHCASTVTTRSDAQLERLKSRGKHVVRSDKAIRATPDDDKYQIRRSAFRHLPMTEAQATRINALVGRDTDKYLTPRQRTLLALIQKHPKADWPQVLGVEFRRAMSQVEAVAATLGKR